jgi:hypothetical protein
MAITKNDAAPAAKNDEADTLAPATEFAASGAVIEPEIVERVDMEHLSVDSNPRERSTPAMNSIDFNNPSALVSQEESRTWPNRASPLSRSRPARRPDHDPTGGRVSPPTLSKVHRH